MKLLLLVVLSCAALALGDEGNADAYVDAVLELARNNSAVRKTVEPYYIDLIYFDGGNATDVYLYGLMSIVRTGPATLKSVGNLTFAIDAELGLDKVHGEGNYSYRGLMPFEGYIAAKAKNVACDARIDLTIGEATLHSFNVGAISGVKITKFTGASFVFNWLAKWIINKVVAKQRGMVKREIEKAGKQVISKALKEIEITKFLPKLFFGKED